MHRQSNDAIKIPCSALLLSLLLLLLASCSEPEPTAVVEEASLVQQLMQDPAALVRGEALYLGSCANYCHAELEADVESVNLFDCEWKNADSDEEISGIPGTRMVGFGSNFPEGDDDLWKIIAYLRSNQQDCSQL
jgi:mono/diheme cytochrome c family protein